MAIRTCNQVTWHASWMSNYIFQRFIWFLIMACVCACASVFHVCVCVFRCVWRPKEGVDTLELKLQLVISGLTWLLGIEIPSSGRTASLYSLAIFPAQIDNPDLPPWDPSASTCSAKLPLYTTITHKLHIERISNLLSFLGTMIRGCD